MTALETLRAQLNAHRGDRPKLTVLPFLISAMCRALADFPMLNARYDDEGTDGGGSVTRFGAVQLGVATQTPQGLMVPVLRGADHSARRKRASRAATPPIDAARTSR